VAIDLTLEYSTLAWGNRTNSTMDRPTNTADGDFLFAGITINSGTITPPAGWTSLGRKNHSEPTGGCVEIFYKRASSEPASWTWTHANTSTEGFVKRITGVVSEGSPTEGSSTTGETAGSGAVSCASITTTSNGAALLQVFACVDTITWSSTTLTERIDAGEICLAADVQATAGASGAKTGTPSTWIYGIAIMVAIAPQAEGGASSTPSSTLARGIAVGMFKGMGIGSGQYP
jgi:hypothetical protein